MWLATAAGVLLGVLPTQSRIVIAVSARDGLPSEDRLRYAADDAERFSSALSELSDGIDTRIIKVTAAAPSDVFDAIAEARSAAENRAIDSLVFYYSGHGSENAIHPGALLPLASLRSALQKIPVALRVVVLDSCRTSLRAKGLRRGAEFGVPDLSIAVTKVEGQVELRAAAEGEAAQESDELMGSIFTHYLVAAMRGAGDRDGDGAVTLDETYSYTYARSLLRTAETGQLQHPEAKIELQKRGDVVMTRPHRSAAILELVDPAERYLVFDRQSGAVVAETLGPAILGVPAGTYLVVQRGVAQQGNVAIDLSLGGRATVRDEDFYHVPLARLALRGADERRGLVRGLRLAIEGGIVSQPTAVDAASGRLALRFGFHGATFGFGLQAGALYASLRPKHYRGEQWSGELLAYGALPFQGLTWLKPRLELLAGGRFTALSLRSNAAAALNQVGLRATETGRYGSFIAELGLRADVPVGNGFGVYLRLAPGFMLRPTLASRGNVYLEASISVSCSAGLEVDFSWWQ